MSNFQSMATRLLKNLSGFSATFKRVTSVYNEDTLTNENTTIEIPITIYQKAVTNGDISSGLASATDIMILISAYELGVIPKQNDYINTFQIEKVITVKEKNGLDALYKCVCKAR